MLPAPRLILLVMAAAPVLLGGAVWEPFIGVGVLYLVLLAALAFVDALLLPRRSSLRVRRVMPPRVSLGAATRVVFEVETSLRRRVEIRLAEDLPENLSAAPAEVAGAFEPGGCGTLEYRFTATKRGRYTLSAVDVRILPSGGLFYRQFRLPLAAEIDVFPNLVNLKRYELLLRRGHEGDCTLFAPLRKGDCPLCPARKRGQPPFPYSRKRVQPPFPRCGRIDWKATAKYSRLVVRNKGGCTLFAPLRKGDCPLCHDGKGDSPHFHTAGNGCSPLFSRAFSWRSTRGGPPPAS